jgi:hypothetical protein
MRSEARHATPRLVEYDAFRNRLWIFGQRCHHGAAGTLVASAAVLIGRERSRFALALTGATLMAHDWKDLPIWFEPGHGSQP